MFFKHYHIVIFKEKAGAFHKLKLRGWLFGLLLLMLGGLVTTNIQLWQYYLNYKKMEKELSLSEKNIQENRAQLASLNEKIQGLNKDLGRIRGFDSKLRAMINLGDETQSVSAAGGAENHDIGKNFPAYRQELLSRKLHTFLQELGTDLKLEEIKQQELLQNLASQAGFLNSTPTIWPADGWISSGFGQRISPFTGKSEFHGALDISAPLGTPIYATAPGKVVQAESEPATGLTVTLDHQGGLSSVYGHMQRLEVALGQKVGRGDVIGHVGNTGRSSGPHLHYEVRLSGVPVNPMRYILN